MGNFEGGQAKELIPANSLCGGLFLEVLEGAEETNPIFIESENEEWPGNPLC